MEHDDTSGIERHMLARAFLSEAQERVDDRLELLMPPREDSTLAAAMRHSLFAGGKRLRPALALATCQALGGNERDALTYGAAVEMIHTYSLIHDDLPAMDDDDLRRGLPTCHKVYGEAVAILAGDALQTHAFGVLASEIEDADIARILALELSKGAGAEGMVGGQAEDLAADGVAPSAAQLARIHRMKTGAMISASVQGGARCSDCEEDEYESLARYGRAIGLAFQIMDDVLDATGSVQQLGKTPGKDEAKNKMTYVALLGIDGARELAIETREEAIASLTAITNPDLLVALAHFVTSRAN